VVWGVCGSTVGILLALTFPAAIYAKLRWHKFGFAPLGTSHHGLYFVLDAASSIQVSVPSAFFGVSWISRCFALLRAASRCFASLNVVQSSAHYPAEALLLSIH